MVVARLLALALAASLALAGSHAAALLADQTAPPADETARRGRLLYRIHCGACHGANGEGDGPMAEVLRRPPTDLTHLDPAPDGQLPWREVYELIDGRRAVLEHGPREMPIWGLTLRSHGPESPSEGEIRGRIDDLIVYLRSIQVTSQPSEPPRR